MFCVFLQNTAPKKDSLVNFVHNDCTYPFSRELSLNHSQKLSELIIHNEESIINLDYFHEQDDFQLICDLFNNKRIFITNSNIEFLEFAANFFQIPILIKKTAKFQSQYNDFLRNPIFQKIKSLRRQIYTFYNPTIIETEYYESDDDLDDKNLENSLGNAETNLKENEHLQLKESEDLKPKENEESKEIESEDLKEIDCKSFNNIEASTFKYDPDYSSTVSHLLLSVCLLDPLNIDKYMEIIKKDRDLLTNFIKAIHSINPIFDLKLFFIHRLMPLLNFHQKEFLFDCEMSFNNTNDYDTKLNVYLGDVGRLYAEMYRFWVHYEMLTELIKRDEIDEFQTKFTAIPKLMDIQDAYMKFLKTSMIAHSVNCFKYLLVNWVPLFGSLSVDKKMVQPSIIGGNIEIFRLILEKYNGSPVDFIQDAILFHKKEIFDWIVENNCQFLSLYNSCCSTVLYGRKYITQKWYNCHTCYTRTGNGCCKFCAKHCHLNKPKEEKDTNDNEKDDDQDKEEEKFHDIRYSYISHSCFCDDDCQLSKNIELIGNKEFVEIDDLILLSIFCLNTYALESLINEGGYIVRCRDIATKDLYSLKDQKLIELISNLKGYKGKSFDDMKAEREKESESESEREKKEKVKVKEKEKE